MKIGAENKKETIAAAVLIVIAVLLLVRMLSAPATSTASPSAPKTTSSAAKTNTLPDVMTNAPAARQKRRGTDEKTLAAVLKPTLDPRLRLDLLNTTQAIKYEGAGRNIFNPESQPVPIPNPVAPGRSDKDQTSAVVANPGPPPPPPINLKFFGYASKSGEPRRIFLAQQDTVYTAREGDIIGGRYKVLKINPTSVQIQDLLSNNTQTIPLTQG